VAVNHHLLMCKLHGTLDMMEIFLEVDDGIDSYLYKNKK
jgi:hypothetical protein